MHTIQSNQTIFDLAILIEGKLDTLVQDVMIKYQLVDISNDYTGTKLDITYNTANKNAKYFYDNDKDIETFDSTLYQEFIEGNLGAFDNDEYNNDYDV